jgi:hypothetical protein
MVNRVRLHIASGCFLFLLLALVAGTVRAQESDAFSGRFDGGRLALDLRWGSNVYGAGLSSGSLGRVQSALAGVDGASVFGNPARLSFVRSGQMGFETRFPIRNRFWDSGSNELDFSTDVGDGAGPVDAGEPSSDQGASYMQVGQPRQLSAFWLAWPVSEHVTVGMGYRQPLRLEGDIRLDGLRTQLTGAQWGAAGLVGVNLATELALAFRGHLVLDEFSIGTGGLLERYYWGSVWWGITAYRYQANVAFELDARPQGSLLLSGGTPVWFNDPGDPRIDWDAGESNALYWTMKGAWRGSGVGLRFGFLHRTYSERLGTTLLVSVPPRLSMRDPGAVAESHLPVFVDVAGALVPNPGEAAFFDIDQLDILRPTLTRRTRDYLGSDLTMRMPSSVTLGADLALGSHRFIVNGLRYWGRLGLEGEYSRENGVIQPFRLLARPTWGLRAGLDLAGRRDEGGLGWWALPIRVVMLDIDGLFFSLMDDAVQYRDVRYRVAASFTWGADASEGVGSTTQDAIQSIMESRYPMAVSLGRSYSLLDRMHVGILVAGYPDALFRFSVAYDVE